MIHKIIEKTVKHRKMIIFLFLIIGLASVFTIQKIKVDAIPDIGENQQIVFTKWPGRSPKDIEQQITYPLSTSLEGIPGVKEIRGTSSFGFSTIYVIFEDDIDFYWSRSRILEKISSTGNILPDEVLPQIGPDATGLGQIFWYTIENKPTNNNPKSLAELRSLQEFFVKYRLQNTEGVSEVASIGGFLQEYQIDVDPKRLFAFDVHFSSLIEAIQNSNIDIGAEVIEDGAREFLVRGRGFFRSIKDIENVVIGVKKDTPIRVKDVARVGIGAGFRRGALDKNGTEAVGGVVTMRFGENPQQVIEAIKERIESIQTGLPEGVQILPFYDRTELIKNTTHTVYKALAQEIIITIVIIMAFLMHLPSSILVSLTLPFGVGIGFIFMHLLDIDSNIMSLSGMVIAIGSMVDMGIVMTENIYSQLIKNPKATKKQRLGYIIDSASEVGAPIFTAILTTIITFLPVFMLSGSEGKLFYPLAWAKTLTMLGSVIVAIFLIPAMSAFILTGELKPIKKPPVRLGLISIYEKILRLTLEHPLKFSIIPFFILASGIYAYNNLGREFMPSLNEGDILYMPVTTPDVSISKARELLSYTDQILESHPLVEYAVGKLGRADSALDPAPISMFETVIKLVPKEQWPANTDIYDIMQILDGKLQIPGLVNSWDFPIQTRIGMISTGIKTQVGVKIFGQDINILENLAEQIGAQLQKIEGAYGVYAEKITGKPYIEFDIDRIAASRFGINAGTVNQILQTAVGGMPIGEFYEGRERYAIRVRYKKELRDRIDELKRVLVPSPLGQHIPLEQLANINVITGPAAIQSENGMLRSLVLLNVRNRDIIGFVEEAKETIHKNITIPEGYSVVWAGQYQQQVHAEKKLSILMPMVILLIITIIYGGTRNLGHSLIIMSAIPLSLAGGLILLWLLGYNTSVAVWVGFIALFGIAVDDGILMTSYLQKSIKDEPSKDWEELKLRVIKAGTRRVRPLIMTTVTTVAALLPIMWSSSQGSEVIKPMAIPTLGGLITLILSLLVVPTLFSYYEKYKIKISNSGK